MNRIFMDTDRVNGIPILTIAPERAERCPLVFFIHGFTGAKEEGAHLGYQLAAAGIVCVCVDAAMHGERPDERLTQLFHPTVPRVYPEESGLDVLFLQAQIIMQTGEDVVRLMDYFAGDTRIDMQRMGVAGVSMGGSVAYYLAATQSRVRAAVPIIGVPDFAGYWDEAVMEARANETWAPALLAAQETLDAHTAFIYRLDPMERLRTFVPKPLLMLVGDQDTKAYKSRTVHLYRQLLPHYGDHHRRLQLRIYKDTDHRVPRVMITDCCQWFCQYLR